MYARINWKDEVRNPDNTFSYTDNGDGTMTFARAGTQAQEGTNQNAVHFNQMDAGIEAANLAVDLLMTYISMKLGFSDKTLDGVTAALAAEIAKIVDGTTVAKKAATLETTRTIAISGGATGTATNFNGSANIAIPVTSLDATKLSGKTKIENGGTNADTAAGARANLDVPSNADLAAAAILDNAMMVVNQAAQRDLDRRLTIAEAQIAAIGS